MQAQLACVLLLCLTCGILCSDVDQEQRAIEEELLSSLFTSKSKQNAPYWRVSLVNVCRMVNSLINSRLWREQEEYNTGEELGERLASLPETLDELLNLQHICRVLQPREVRDAHRDACKHTVHWDIQTLRAGFGGVGGGTELELSNPQVARCVTLSRILPFNATKPHPTIIQQIPCRRVTSS
uniref:Neurotensin/neuromedin N n=1 Tax=Hucho hucho TaxID=62062 RepID=A0A4W5P799_9TELE